MCKIPVWFSNNCCITIRFLAVDIKLLFVLGMKVLRRVHVQLDLETCMLTLCGDDGSIIEMLRLYKWAKVLLLAVLAQIQVLKTYNALGKNMYAYSAKQVK